MKKSSRYIIVVLIGCWFLCSQGFGQSDTAALEKLRRESGVDPTRVQSRIGNSLQVFDRPGGQGQVIDRVKLTVGVSRWSFGLSAEGVAATAGSGFTSGFGDMKFSLLNAFYVKGPVALAASGEFNVPTGKPGIGTQYFSLNMGLTFSYTLNSTLFLAVQPQYTFDLIRGQQYPDLNVVTVRSFLARFYSSGYFLVGELRPVFDFTSDQTDLIFSPILGKSLGGGFNLVGLVEYSFNRSVRTSRGTVFQIGVNKNF